MKIALLTTDNREHCKRYELPAPYFGTAPEALIQGFAMLPETEVHVVSCVRKPMDSPEKLAGNVWFHTLLVPKIGWMSTGYQGCIRAIRRKLREIQPDIVHGQGTERDCAITAIFSGFPNVLTIHGNMRLIARVNRVKPYSYDWINARLERFTLPFSDGVVCISHYTENAVRNLARRTWLLPNAVDAAFFDVKPHPANPPEIVVTGWVCYRKNQNLLIRALDPVAAERSVRVLFLGNANKEEPYGAEFFELLRERPWCQWLGFASREELRARVSTAALLVLPSIEDNCPMAVLEAAAAGIPVIASNVGGVPDLVKDGVNGLLCDPGSAESMRDAVRQLLDDTALASTLAGRAKRDAMERFHPLHIAKEHLKIYREILESKTRSRA